jgi:hypothetical protein
VWAILLVEYGSVAWPILSHLVFDMTAGYQLSRPAPDPTGSEL